MPEMRKNEKFEDAPYFIRSTLGVRKIFSKEAYS